MIHIGRLVRPQDVPSHPPVTKAGREFLEKRSYQGSLRGRVWGGRGQGWEAGAVSPPGVVDFEVQVQSWARLQSAPHPMSQCVPLSQVHRSLYTRGKHAEWGCGGRGNETSALHTPPERRN